MSVRIVYTIAKVIIADCLDIDHRPPKVLG
jgi:hypothetical protein